MPTLRPGQLMTRQTAGTPASFTFSAAGGTLTSGMTLSRASPATRINARGYLEEVTANTARFTYDPTLTYNEVSKPWLDAVVGGLPDGWAEANQAGHFATSTVLGVGADGLPFADVTFTGSPSNTTAYVVVMQPNEVPAVAGSVWSGEVRACVLPGAVLNGATVRVGTHEMNGDTVIAGIANEVVVAEGTTPVRYRVSGTLTNGATTNVRMCMRVGGYPASGPVLTFTVRFVFPVLNRGASYLTDSVGVPTLAARVGTTPQYGLLGLLREEASSNVITNPRCEGAVVGAPGTIPTGWGFVGAPASIDRTIVSFGAEAGIPYVDIRFAGTPAGGGQIQCGFLPAGSGAAAVVGQTWTASMYATIVGGSLANITSPTLSVVEYNGGAFTGGGGSGVSLAGGSLAAARKTATFTLAGATTNNVISNFTLNVSAGLAVDVTIRFGLPQLEQQQFPTSPMLPTAGAPAVSSRSRDSVQLPVSGLGFPAGAISVRFQLLRWGSPAVGAANNWLFAAGESAERVSSNMASDVPSINVVQGGVAVMGRTRPGGTAPRDTWINGAVTWGGGSGDISWDGEAPVNDATCPSPAPVAPLAFLGANWGDNANQSAPIIFRYVRFWDTKLSQAQLRKESAKIS